MKKFFAVIAAVALFSFFVAFLGCVEQPPAATTPTQLPTQAPAIVSSPTPSPLPSPTSVPSPAASPSPSPQSQVDDAKLLEEIGSVASDVLDTQALMKKDTATEGHYSFYERVSAYEAEIYLKPNYWESTETRRDVTGPDGNTLKVFVSVTPFVGGETYYSKLECFDWEHFIIVRVTERFVSRADRQEYGKQITERLVDVCS